MEYSSINPFTHLHYNSFSTLNDEEVDNCLLNAKMAYNDWKTFDFNTRASHLLRLANLLLNNKNQLASIITEEVGKPIGESIAEIEKSVIACEYYAYQAEEMLNNEDVFTDASLSYIKYEPLGVILGIMPWNYPLWQVIRFVAPSLMAGNVCILKPAPNVPRSTIFLATLIDKANFPIGVFQYMFIEIAKIEQLIASPIVKAISLTGSTNAGRSVAAMAGKYLKKCVLELGGSDPFIVLPSANVQNAVEGAIKSRLINNGQSCIAAKRFIIHKDIYDEFLAILISKLSLIKIGNPLIENIDTGPMARADLAEMLINQVKECLKLGAQLIFGDLSVNDNCISPMVVTNINNTMPAYNEELFGPVFAIFKVDNEEEAIQMANDSIYGLSASLWCSNHTTVTKFIDELEVGAVFVNGISRSDIRLPFGGVKNSGYGKELSSLGIKEFTNAKTVWIKNN